MNERIAEVAAAVDTVGAFCPNGRFIVSGAISGPLAGLTFGAKDLFDVAGHVTGAGNPRWKDTHLPAVRTAPAVQTLLDAGAWLVGKTLTDELAYSLNGDNIHYGTPVNVNAPGRVPGGSSSGSAAAVAARLCDFGLATDSGGSVRVPASFCGIYGIRTTHGRIPMAGTVPLMPSFDTVGWMARTAHRVAQVGSVLLSTMPGRDAKFTRLIVLEDAFAEAAPEVARVLKSPIEKLTAHFATTTRSAVTSDGLEAWRTAFRIFSAAETWRVHGAWIKGNRPEFAPAIAERFAFAESVSAADAARAGDILDGVRSRLAGILRDDTFLCLPSAPGPAPWIDAPSTAVEGFRQRTQRLTCIASIAALPQISIPAGVVDGAPVGLSLIGPRYSDERLITLAELLSVSSP